MMNRDQLHAHKATHDRKNSWWLRDAMGIEVSRVCDACEDAVKAQYDPAIFGESPGVRYKDVVDEPIEAEDYC